MIAQTEIIQHLFSLEERLLQPQIRHSTKDLSEIVAEDFYEIGSSGRTYNKQQLIETLLKSQSVRISIEDFQVKLLLPGLAQTIYRTAKQSRVNGKTEYSMRSSIWMFKENSWRIVFHQGTIQK